MDDDIDIKDHDILDNPVIIKRFSDISHVKEEILQDYEDVPDIKQEPITENPEVQQNILSYISTNADIDSPHIHKPDISVKILTNYNNNSPNVSKNYPCIDKLGVSRSRDYFKHKNKQSPPTQTPVWCSKIIIGSKPNPPKIDKVIKTRKLKIILKDIGLSLLRSNKYCYDCRRMFPSQSDIRNHNINEHQSCSPKQQKYNVGNNYFISRNNRSLRSRLVFENDDSDNENLSDKTDFVHSVSFTQSSNRQKNKIQVEIVSKSSLNTEIQQKEHIDMSKQFKTKTISNHRESKNKTVIAMTSKQPKNIHNVNAIFCNKSSIRGKKDVDDIIDCDDSDDSMNSDDELVYECTHCSYMTAFTKDYYWHVIDKHNIKTISKVNKVKFNGECKYCPAKHTSKKAHNSHLQEYHTALIDKIMSSDSEDDEHNQIKTNQKSPLLEKYNSFVLKSHIFKCLKCDIHFLSSLIAQDHVHHMEMLVNWKCPHCARIFKNNDKELHLKQHEFSATLDVHQFDERELSTLMYCCTKCTIHFTEERYMEHYFNCETEKQVSIYCRICDILIDKESVVFNHEVKHKNTFAIIADDIISDDKKIYITLKRKLKEGPEQVNSLTFCKTCKCFLSNLGVTRKSHAEARCANIPKFICDKCGLTFTNVSIRTHRNKHKLNPSLNIHDFVFLDINGDQISPPIPEFPSCNKCKVHFKNKNLVKNHVCSETISIECSVCAIELSAKAFELHTEFHDYSMHQVKKKRSDTATSNLKSKKINDKIKPNTTKETDMNQNNKINNIQNLLFSCQCCSIAFESYDKVIEHCQSHYSTVPSTQPILKICTKCKTKFEIDAYKIHQKLHSSNSTIQWLTFDPTYFVSDIDTWNRHIFGSLSQSEQDSIAGASIYHPECRIKMDVVQKGPSHLTIYKCDKCGNFVESKCLLTHVEKCISCGDAKRFPCSTCGLPFASLSMRNIHKQIHCQYENIRAKSYNIVLVNCEAHQMYNKSIFNNIRQYVLYQCRSCDGIVDKLLRNSHQCNLRDLKKCSICNLLFNTKDFDLHVIKHNNLPRFKARHMKVVLFGQTENKSQKSLHSSFKGLVFDYMLYKCTKCEVHIKYLRTTSRHACVFNDNNKCKCHTCGLVLTQSHMKSHLKMHNLDPDYNLENIRIVMFN